jgi:hypothetical protein
MVVADDGRACGRMRCGNAMPLAPFAASLEHARRIVSGVVPRVSPANADVTVGYHLGSNQVEWTGSRCVERRVSNVSARR